MNTNNAVSAMAWGLALLAIPLVAQQSKQVVLADEPVTIRTAMTEPQSKSGSAYPPSKIIANFTIQPERISIGNGDNWPITWADNGDQYTVYCDGKGFGGGSGEGSMSLARISGDPPDFTGHNVISPTGHMTGGGPEGRKASGLLMVDGILYMWVRNLNKDGTGANLAWSEDRARLDLAHWSFPEMGYPTWLNAGKDYSVAQDEFAYTYSPDTASAYKTSDHIVVARVRKAEVRDKEAYRFFAGLGGDGNPTMGWQISTNASRCSPIRDTAIVLRSCSIPCLVAICC